MIDYAKNRTMMVDTQVRPSDVTKFPIIDALLSVRREAFVPENKRHVAYAGENLALGADRVLLEPRSFAKLLDALDIQRGDVVLNIGCGFGYPAAVLAHMTDAVVALEEDETMARDAEDALLQEGIDNAVVITGPLADGAAKHGPYDVIYIEGAVAQVPQAVLDQLRDGGRIGAIFTEGQLSEARVGYKTDGRVSWRLAFNAGAPVLPGFATEPSFAL
ncbi:protein-L-isoaspartate(D-aspartate) O-methyltransferase [Litoreibacter ponti]|uniref:Protein-L-isoaspartate O-methyltransferase n=1 Tax=Litoreibacter ponti TaxID=1510457 RepID=A0A2T6BL80_9RHOB|nr:protein-L-isoaspartate O-methyltransferase [Litoreibacter ponti]PTX56809.1 protein-L-isoaspartate(D-aspartate) O-methyltransferase [Litoreibacter ponti]